MKTIRGYAQGQAGGAGLVTIDDAPLGLPMLAKGEARHSPGGFQWGYGGSGPAELARAILIALYPHDPVVRAIACYQTFKWNVIARLPKEGFELTSDAVDEWYQGWRASDQGRCEILAAGAQQMLL
jgi:Family of unknown function (DUF6166)